MYLDTSRAMNSAAHEVFVVTRFTLKFVLLIINKQKSKINSFLSVIEIIDDLALIAKLSEAHFQMVSTCKCILYRLMHIKSNHTFK